MQKIEWSSKLSVGIGLIDEQHKKWISHYNEVVEAIKSGKNQEQIVKTLDFITDYTDFHFHTEQKYMSENNYPGYEKHRAEHKELKDTVKGLVRDYREDGVSPSLANGIETLLGNWLVKHIQEFDLEFAKFAKDKNIVMK